MSNTQPREAWQCGPVDGVPPLLMPVAHALMQAREEAERALTGLTLDQIWHRPAGAASVGFHVRHLGGALDRLFTYARGEQLSNEQRRRVPAEGVAGVPPASASDLLADLDSILEHAFAQVRATAESTLLDLRGIGRQQIPTTVIGLLFHAAEHASRHAGQAITTARIRTRLRAIDGSRLQAPDSGLRASSDSGASWAQEPTSPGGWSLEPGVRPLFQHTLTFDTFLSYMSKREV